MSCHFCGVGDRWIKTCRAPDGARLRICDPCYAIRASVLVIVTGDYVVTARCDRCGVYGNPREFAEVMPASVRTPTPACAGHAPKRKASWDRLTTPPEPKPPRRRGDDEEDPRLRSRVPRLLVRRGKCRIRIYRGKGQLPVVVCTQLPDNNTSVTNMAEYLAAEVVEEHSLPTPLVWVEHYPENRGGPGEWSSVAFSSWEAEEACLGGVRRRRVGRPRWSPLTAEEVAGLTGAGRRPPRTLEAR